MVSTLRHVSFFFFREAKIAENMKNMPKMVEEHREKMRSLRRARREKKEASEEKKYLLATGKASERPAWQVFMEKRLKEQGKKK